jgi:hypothetical protein
MYSIRNLCTLLKIFIKKMYGKKPLHINFSLLMLYGIPEKIKITCKGGYSEIQFKFNLRIKI